jgi:hypothetical protein
MPMQVKNQVRAIANGLAAAAALAFVTLTMLTFATSDVQATPALAKGKACTTCHTGSPPNKSNVKK